MPSITVGVQVLPALKVPASSSPTKTPEFEKDFLLPEQKSRHMKRRGSSKGPENLKVEKKKPEPQSNWNVTGRSQWQYPSDLYVKDQRELKDLDQFIFSKVCSVFLQLINLGYNPGVLFKVENVL
jgi:hypothetical protein